MTTGVRRPTTEAVNSRLLILPFRMDAIVHKHAATLRQLLGNIFDVAQSSYIVLPLVFYGRPIFFGRLNKTDKDFGTHSWRPAPPTNALNQIYLNDSI